MVIMYTAGHGISTHTLTWSVTGKTYAVCEQEINFNSHAHVERDAHFTTLPLYYTNFNSHAHVERDDNEINSLLNTLEFQLTRSRGA